MRGMKSQAPSVVLQAIFILSQRTYICQSHRIAFRWAGLAVLSPRFASAHGWPCGSVAAFCHRFTPGFAFLSRRFAIGSWLALRSCRGALPSAHACLCVPVAVLCHRFTPVFFLLEEKETACGSLRSCSAGSRSPFARSPVSARLSALAGSLWGCAFLYGDLDG